MTVLAAPRAELELLAAMTTTHGDVRDTILVDHHLTAEHFADPARRAIFAAIVDAHDQGARGELSLAALAPAVKDNPLCTPQQAQDALRDVNAAFCASFDVVPHIRALTDLCRRRRWQHAAQILQRAATDGDRDLIAQVEQLLGDTAGQPTDRADEQQIAALVAEYLDTPGHVGYSTGLPSLDEAMGGGFRPGDTSALAAWTGFGKSVLSTGGWSCTPTAARRFTPTSTR